MTILDIVAKAIYEYEAVRSSFMPRTYEEALEMEAYWRPLAFTDAREKAKLVIDGLAIAGYLHYEHSETVNDRGN